MKARVLLAFSLLVGSLSAQLQTGSMFRQQPASALVSAEELAVPPSARREFDKAIGLMEKQDFIEAAQRLNQAIVIYPDYASAYNNLAVVYSRLGDSTREQRALEKAIRIDDHFALAYVNQGRMYLSNQNFTNAELALGKASSLNPNDTASLTLLSYCQLMQQRFEDAIATARKAHALPGEHALVHRIAANAFERKQDASGAIAELELFLKEQPTGSTAEKSRQELQRLRRWASTASQ
jgi:tetratricopeptide (TPR) repeat protein